MSINNPAYKEWLDSVVNPYESITVLEKSEVSNLELSDISEALEEYVRLFKAEIASPAEILTLSRAYPDEDKYSLAVIDQELDQKEPVVVGGPASVEVVDREGHLITISAMERAFDKFMANFRTRNAMVLHSDVQVGWALPAYISKTGAIYKSGVTGDHLFFITELRDDTKIAKKVLDQIATGKMKSYSIAGSATSVEAVQKVSGMVMQVNDMELAEVTICEQGVNQKAKFELMKSGTDRPTSSCVDGSCLIKSQSHVHSKTELFVNDDGIIDTVGSFSNWVQKAGLYENIHARRKSGKRMRSEGDPKAPTDADFRDAARVKKGVGMTMQKSPLEQLDDHLEKSIYDDPEDRPTPEAEAEKRKMIREANERDAGTKSVGKFAGGRFEAEDDFQRMKGKEVLEMQKSHLEGCGCASCTQRTGDTNGDDTARPATDRNGRPTLGHMGHGNVVAILVSRMQRKADKNYDMDQFGSYGERDEAVWEDKLKGQPKLESTDENFQAWRKENPDAPSHLFPSKMQKAVYEYINKSKGNPGPGKKDGDQYRPEFVARNRKKAVERARSSREPNPKKLKELLDAGKITQEQHDGLASGKASSVRVPSGVEQRRAGMSALEAGIDRDKNRKALGNALLEERSASAARNFRSQQNEKKKPASEPEEGTQGKLDLAKGTTQLVAFLKENTSVPATPKQPEGANTGTGSTKAPDVKPDPDPEPEVQTQPKDTSKPWANTGGSGGGIIGDLVRSAQDIAGVSHGKPVQNMQKQEPEWVTPQVERPLHKFLDYNSKNGIRS